MSHRNRFTRWRDGVRAQPGLRHAYRTAVFFAGLLCIAIGLALAVLPGPLTIPPILVGLWIWSTEFTWAHNLFESFKRKGHEAWEHARARPVSSALITVGGLVAAGVAVWAIAHFELVAKGREAVGL
jgi:hypothetical protein